MAKMPDPPSPLEVASVSTTWRYDLPDVLHRLGLPRGLNVTRIHYMPPAPGDNPAKVSVTFERSGLLDEATTGALITWLEKRRTAGDGAPDGQDA